MHNPESILENETHKLLLDFAVEISTKRPNLMIVNTKKEKLPNLETLPFRLTTE